MTPLDPSVRARSARSGGFTLIELMIAVTLGLIILAALTSFFVQSSQNRTEMERNGRQIENGRYAISTLRGDIALAGFFADVTQPSTTIWNVPNACETNTANMGFTPNALNPQLPVPIFVYSQGVGRPTGCTPDYLAGTDVLVVRRLNTEPTPIASVDPAQVYLQISECQSDNTNTPYILDRGSNAGALALHKLNCTATADVRRYREQLYYVRDYSVTAGDGIPTLVRVELDAGASNAVPLVEGIENLRVDFGIDNDTDGLPEVWSRCDTASPCNATAWANVMAVKIYVVSRNLEPTNGYTDDKRYGLGLSGATIATNDHYKRHVYSAQVAMPNRSGPREPIL